MGIRVTEISTPFGGVAWEYTDKKKDAGNTSFGCRTENKCLCEFQMR